MAGMDGGAGAPLAGDLACVEGGAGSGPDGGGAVARAKRAYVRRTWTRKLSMVREACRRIAERGETITEVCRDPRMPGRSTFMAWLAREPALWALVEAARAEAAAVFGARRDYHYWDEAVADEFLARIEDGRGLREVCDERDMPAHATITRWLRERPEFAARYRLAREAQADRLFDLAWTIAREAGPGEVETARLMIQTLKWRIGRLSPRVYGPQKALGPADAAGVGEGGRSGRSVVSFVVRRWAKTPAGEMAEYTWAAQGRTEAEAAAVRADIEAGRVDAEALARLNAAGRAKTQAEGWAVGD